MPINLSEIRDLWMLDTPDEDGGKVWTYRARTPDVRTLFDRADLDARKIEYVEDAEAVALGVTDHEQRVPYAVLSEAAKTF